jgi:hypothetical protein
MKSHITTIILAVSLGVVLVLLGKVAWTNHQLTNRTEQLNSQLMQAKLDVGRAETMFGDASAKIHKLNKQIQDEIEARDAEITRYGELKARYDVLVAKKPVTKTETIYISEDPIECPNTKFVRGLIYEAITDKSLLPLREYTGRLEDFRISIDCTITPVPNDQRHIPMSAGYQLHQKFGGQLVETRLPTGGINHYVTLFEIGPEGQRLDDLKLDSWEVVVTDETAPKWFWWTPHLDILGFVGAGPENLPYLGGSLGVSFMGYGVTEDDLSWRVLRISGDFGTDVGIGITPALYNLGDLIPLISNLWVGPHVSKGLNTTWTLGVVLGAQL